MGSAAAPRRSARDRALHVLLACRDGMRFGSQVLGELQAAEPLSDKDAALAAELVIGVGRHRITAEHIVSRFYRGRWAGLREPIRLILALATYQLCWLDRIPDHAAIDQAVRQTKRYGRYAASNVNAVLRQVAACRGDSMDRTNDADPRRFLPIGGGRGRLFQEDVFPDPARRPLEFLVAVTGHPPWLVERWHRRFKPALCRVICDAGQRRPPLVLRANPLRATPDELFGRLSDEGRHPERIAGTDAILLRDCSVVGELAVFREGLCQPQDSTAQIALKLADPKPGELVLDYCAGAGTKSTQAAELMVNDGLVIATDRSSEQLARISENAARLGIAIIQSVEKEALADYMTATGRAPDLIVIDVPCTNTGVLARRPEARYRASHRSLMELVEIQRGILEEAAAFAGPRTRLIYATCSLEEEENERQAAWFCEMHAAWRIEREVFTTPNDDRDGG
ncbi:MAG: hypothetical protein O7D94_03920, partial [Planctomycetota bacterium]|nr:hypothetical protein [Planctomycetota bacterium]